ncbi:MAG: addiction module protein [Gammaproteobacteria bacterium]|nr:addiction module protein [Gammaproteobacteria bacterium]MDH3507066.1 addiction module protein [Gammaproteobacteria bacterium]
MAKSLSEIESEARQLSTKERARLVRRLLATLENEDEGDVEQAWLDEAERRLAAYRSGETTARPAEEVFEAILSRY